jgi:hypothetical protein
MRPATALAVLFLLVAPTAVPDDDPEVTKLLAVIQGKEKQPAGTVFKSVKLLADIPADRFLRIMDVGYAQSLGVMCDHCHVEDRWEADEKRPKLAAREMIVMTREINEKLGTMENIDTSDATVNCTTCHRGYVKPAIQMK